MITLLGPSKELDIRLWERHRGGTLQDTPAARYFRKMVKPLSRSNTLQKRPAGHLRGLRKPEQLEHRGRDIGQSSVLA